MSHPNDKYGKEVAAIIDGHGITLETQNSDSLDFHKLAVWELKELLDAAYKAGKASSK